MALTIQKNNETKYACIRSCIVDEENICKFNVLLYDNFEKTTEPLILKETFKFDSNSKYNTIEQAYFYIKTLPEYANSLDV
jgi:hypothetical protein